MTDSTILPVHVLHVSLDVFLIRMQSRSDRAVAGEQAAVDTSMRGGRFSNRGCSIIIHMS